MRVSTVRLVMLRASEDKAAFCVDGATPPAPAIWTASPRRFMAAASAEAAPDEIALVNILSSSEASLPGTDYPHPV